MEQIEDILVIDGDIVILWESILNYRFNDKAYVRW